MYKLDVAWRTRDCRCYGDSAISTLCPARGCTCARNLSQYCVWPFPSPAVAARHDSSLTNREIRWEGLFWGDRNWVKTKQRVGRLFIQSIIPGGCCWNNSVDKSNRNEESTCIKLGDTDWLTDSFTDCHTFLSTSRRPNPSISILNEISWPQTSG